MCPVRLDKFDNSWYSPGRSRLIQILWLFGGLPLLRSAWITSSGFRRWLLCTFGARIGKGVILKPGVRVKYPWHLEIGDSTWIGEDVWIDNLVLVAIGSNACISQGVYICTGNHDWTDPAFGLKVGPVHIADGAWVGAKAVLCPGITVAECAVAAVGSIIRNSLDAYTVYAGNPAIRVTSRRLRNPEAPGRAERESTAE